MAIAYTPVEIDQAQLQTVTGPVRTQLADFLRGTHLPLDRFRLLAITRWLDVIERKSPEDWPDIHRAGRDASRVLGEMVDALDQRIQTIDSTIAMGFLDWSLIRRHMLLESRRAQLVKLLVDLEDMVHTLLSLY
jgi:hypothetical protein